MITNIEKEITNIIDDKIAKLDRPDLFRRPLVAFSSAADEKYTKLKEIIGQWHLTPKEVLPGAKSVISYFVPFAKNVVLQPKAVKDGAPLWEEAYTIINSYFDDISEAVSNYLTEYGFSAKTIHATHTYDPKDLKSMWSHRSAAAIAGLGVFGANRMLITEKGSGGRFCSVLTSAELKKKQTPIRKKCLYTAGGSCGLCFKICPVKALAAGGIDIFSCQDELDKNDMLQRKNTGYTADTCGKCISVCPVAYIE